MISSYEICVQGFSFEKAASLMYQQFNDNPKFDILIPATVNATLSIELYLKSILQEESGNFPKNRDGHNIKVLFEKLSEDSKAFIRTKFESLIGNIDRQNLISKLEEKIGKKVDKTADDLAANLSHQPCPK